MSHFQGDTTVPQGRVNPEHPSVGQIFWNTDEAHLIVWTGTEWLTVKGAAGDGQRGPDGPPGPTGPPGEAGPEGPAGSKGEQGDRGRDGTEGAPGKDGNDGAAGAAGAKGDKGDQGEYPAPIMDADIANNAEISPEKLNLSGSKLVVGSESSLLIIGGIIQTTSWSPEAGEGFGWSPDTVGSGKITFFPTVFDGVPSVTLTAMTSDRLLTVTSSTLTGSTCNVTALNGAGAEADTRFSFIALGKRL